MGCPKCKVRPEKTSSGGTGRIAEIHRTTKLQTGTTACVSRSYSEKGKQVRWKNDGRQLKIANIQL
jgi:hypothetical protein